MLRLARRLASAVALILLVWTVADLALVQCCLHEQRLVAASGCAVGSPQSSPADEDSCFCCARCVDTAMRIRPLERSVVWTDFAEPVRHLATRSAVIDHPPQNA